MRTNRHPGLVRVLMVLPAFPVPGSFLGGPKATSFSRCSHLAIAHNQSLSSLAILPKTRHQRSRLMRCETLLLSRADCW